MNKLTKVLLFVFGVALIMFAVTFTVYFFNLDMKLMAKVEPWLQKHYDNIPRKQSL